MVHCKATPVDTFPPMQAQIVACSPSLLLQKTSLPPFSPKISRSGGTTPRSMEERANSTRLLLEMELST